MDEESIRKQAKALMDEFMEALGEAEDLKEDVGIEREHNVRKPAKPELTEGFPESMLRNAPSKKDRYIAVEKKKW